MQLDEQQIAVLKATLDRIVPEEHRPAGWAETADEWIVRQMPKDLGRRAELLPEVLTALWMECLAVFNVAYESLWGDQQDEMLMRLECDNVRTEWTVPPRKAFALLQTAAEKRLRSLGVTIEGDDPFTEDDAALALSGRTSRPATGAGMDENLQVIVDAWATLPDAIKTGIVAMVKAAK